jgi:hypothetical protein
MRPASVFLVFALACSNATAPSPLTPYFAYTVAPVNGGSVFFTGRSAIWYAVPHNQSGYFFLALTGSDQNGPINFDCPLFNWGASGPRFRSLLAPDTIYVGTFAAETVLANLGTCSGTRYADSGKLIIRELSGGFLVGVLDLWMSGPVRLTGTYTAGPP